MRLLRAGFLPVSCFILVAAGLVIPLPWVLEQPGRTLSLAACVGVEHDEAGPVRGEFLLMTISVQGATAYDIARGIPDPRTRVVLRTTVVPAGVDYATYFDDQRKKFELMADRAAAIGLQAAGFPAEISGEGAEVIDVQPDSPAAGVLGAGDVIVGVDEVDVTDETDLRAAVEALPAGEPVAVRVQRSGDLIPVELAPAEIDGRTVLGVYATTYRPRAELPVAVDVSAGRVGGPSAGLMIALTVYDKVLPGIDVAQGRTIAGTGTIDDEGRVGPIGGAGLKVSAAERAGADVFLVPATNYNEAVAAISQGSGLEVVSVETFEDARQALGEGEGTGQGAPNREQCPYEPAT